MGSRYRAQATAGTASTTDAPGFSNPDPTKPTNFRFEEDGSGKFLKWDRNSRVDMVGGHYVLQRSDTENGTYETINGGDNITNPASGNTVSQKDVSAVPNGKWYRVKAVNIYNNSSSWTRPIKVPIDSLICEVRVRIRQIDGLKYTGKDKATVEFSISELVDVYKNETTNAMLTPVGKPRIITDNEGAGCIDLYRSSAISDQLYTAEIVNGDTIFVSEDPFIIPDQANVDLMDIATFIVST